MFPFKAEFHDDKLLVSYLSRVARLNGLPGLADLLLDLGLDHATFRSGDGGTIQSLSVLLDVNPESALARSFKKGRGEVCHISGQVVADQQWKSTTLHHIEGTSRGQVN